jgi:hypothetical protein
MRTNVPTIWTIPPPSISFNCIFLPTKHFHSLIVVGSLIICRRLPDFLTVLVSTWLFLIALIKVALQCSWSNLLLVVLILARPKRQNVPIDVPLCIMNYYVGLRETYVIFHCSRVIHVKFSLYSQWKHTYPRVYVGAASSFISTP